MRRNSRAHSPMLKALGAEAHRLAMGAVTAWGLIYTTPGAFRLATDKSAVAHWSDAWFYGWGPVAIYVLLGAAIVDGGLPQDLECNLVALSLLALLLLSVRNAWDLVTWIAPRRGSPPPA